MLWRVKGKFIYTRLGRRLVKHEVGAELELLPHQVSALRDRLDPVDDEALAWTNGQTLEDYLKDKRARSGSRKPPEKDED